MGTLTLIDDAPPDFRKGIISVWIRVPAETMGSGLIVPILTWGSPQDETQYSTSTGTFTELNPCFPPGPSNPVSLPTESLDGGSGVSTPPSYLAINCTGTPYLEVHIQTADTCDCSNTSDITTGYTFVGDCDTPNSGNCGGPPFFYGTIEDTSFADSALLEFFGNSANGITGCCGGGIGSVPFGTPAIGAAEKWHHIIVSWDLTGGTAATGWDGSTDPDTDFGHRGETEFYVSSYSKLWCSIDDANKAGLDLPAMQNYWFSLGSGPAPDPNAMVSWVAGGMAANAGPAPDGCGTVQSTMSTSVTSVPFTPFCIPSSVGTDLSNSPNGGQFGSPSNLRIDMAELQVFAGVSIDTSDVSMRRLFVTAGGDPVTPSVAKGALGDQVIVLSGQANWQHGTNTGTDGDFVPSGTINPFLPGPQIGA